MAIKVGHSGNAGAVAGAAFAGAQGQARSAIGAQARAASERERARRAAEAEAERQRQFQAEQAGLGRQFQTEQALLGNSLQQDNMRLNAGLQGQLGDQAFVRSQHAADLGQIRQREDLVYGLTTRQRMELDQLADSEAKAMADPAFSPSEKEELRYRFAQKRAGLQPVARPRPKTAAELFAERTHTDAKTGRVYALDENGMPGRAIYEPPERRPTVQDRTKAWDVAMKSATDPLTGAVSQKKAQAYYDMIMQGTELPEDQAPPSVEPAQETPAAKVEPSVLGGLSALWRETFGGSEPDLSTPVGMSKKVMQINAPEVERGAVSPGDVQNLATADYQIGLASDALKELEAAAEADSQSGEDLSRPSAVARSRTLEVRAERLRERLKALNEKRGAMIEQRDFLAGQLAAARLRGAK